MQQGNALNPRTKGRLAPRRTGAAILAFASLMAAFSSIMVSGCGGTTGHPRSRPDADRPHEGITLTLSCPDNRLAGLLSPMAKVWGERSGAKVTVTERPMSLGEACDIGVLSSADLGTWAEQGELLAVPGTMKEPGHPYQWSGVLPAYRGEAYAGWGSQLFGLPLAAPGYVLLYRVDRFNDTEVKLAFQTSRGRPLAVPTTWEDFADTAAFFASRDKRPSLPPLPADPDRLVGLFSRIASCFDRPALKESGPGAAAPLEAESLAFQFRLNDGSPRLEAPAFVKAVERLRELKEHGCLPDPLQEGSDSAAVLAKGRAVMAILSLDELARFRKGREKVSGYGIAPLPGTSAYFDAAGGQPVPSPDNYVPHFVGGWLGVVRTGCMSPAAAWNLLAELAGPTRSLELIAVGGYGPTRDTHLDRDRLIAWYGYGLDDEQSKALQDALRANVGKTIRNPTFGLRGPDHETLTSILADRMGKVIAGEVTANKGMAGAVESWEQSVTKIPREERIAWRRRAVGLK